MYSNPQLHLSVVISGPCFPHQKDTGIAINCLALGSAKTEMLEAAFPGYEPPVTASEMASFIKNFALNGNKFISGKIIQVSLSTP